jgi:CheY-like chemotaxis protein
MPNPLLNAGLRILLVEDSEAGRRSLSRLLELRGFRVTAVGDGTSALHEMEQGEPPDIVLTDLMLPDLDGRIVAQRAAQIRPRPIVAITTGDCQAREFESDESHAVDVVFLKPLDTRDVIQRLLHLRESRATESNR